MEGPVGEPTVAGRIPRVSVVMTTYNAARFVKDAVASILGQTMEDLELVVVDDGSTDRTRAILEGFAARDGRLRPLFVPRCGRIAALNLAVRESRGPLIANQDADDVSLPRRLEVLASYLDSHPPVALVGAARVPRIDAKGREIDELARPTDPAKIRWLLGRWPPFFHSSVMYRKSAWEALGGFDESLACFEDYDLWVRMAARYEVALVDERLALKRRHAGQHFDQKHWSNRGYRTRARIRWRYF